MVNESLTKEKMLHDMMCQFGEGKDIDFFHKKDVRSAYLLAFKDMWGYIGNVGLSDDFDFVKLMNILTEAFKGVAEE